MFEYTPEEKQEALVKYFNKDLELSLVILPKKQKQKYLCLLWIISLFENDKLYNEKEVNLILKNVYFDYVMIRRYLIDYRLLIRKDDGSVYWVNKEEEK
jgi:hypothetical protein